MTYPLRHVTRSVAGCPGVRRDGVCGADESSEQAVMPSTAIMNQITRFTSHLRSARRARLCAA